MGGGREILGQSGQAKPFSCISGVRSATDQVETALSVGGVAHTWTVARNNAGAGVQPAGTRVAAQDRAEPTRMNMHSSPDACLPAQPGPLNGRSWVPDAVHHPLLPKVGR